MSWVDLAALAIILWNAVSGYLRGIKKTWVLFFITVSAVPLAFLCHRPFLVYLNLEMGLEAYVSKWYLHHAQTVMAAAQPGRMQTLPLFTENYVAFFAPEQQLLPAVTGGSLLQLLGLIVARLLVFFLLLLFFMLFARYLLRLRRLEAVIDGQPEWQRIAGLLLGAGHGFALAMICCIAMDVFFMMLYSAIWPGDFYSSYLARAAVFCMNMLFS